MASFQPMGKPMGKATGGAGPVHTWGPYQALVTTLRVVRPQKVGMGMGCGIGKKTWWAIDGA